MKAKRTRVEPNIYQYPDGRYEVLVSHAGWVARATRFPATTPLEQIRSWVAQTRRRLAQEARERGELPRTSGGTLEGDGGEFFSQIAGRAGTAADISHFRAWCATVVDGVRLGDLPRHALTTAHANKAIAQWQSVPSAHTIRRVAITGYTRKASTIAKYERRAPATSGRVVAAKTIRHRCRVLADFYRTLDGPEAPTPVDHAKIPKRTKTPPVTVPPEMVADVLRKLRVMDAPTFARFYVAATTGQRPCQIGRARPEDVQLSERVWLVRDAKGEPAHAITLEKPQIAAWRAFIDANAWSWEQVTTARPSGFDSTRYGRLVHAAGWPRGVRPYAARHALAIEAIKRGVNLGDLQGLLGHADPATTRIYAPFVVERQRAVSKAMASYLADVAKPRLVRKGTK
jgi:integrase